MPTKTSPGATRRGDGGDYEYAPLRIPPGTDRATAALQMSLQAEYGGWELDTVRLFADGTRRIRLRRRRTRSPLPGLST